MNDITRNQIKALVKNTILTKLENFKLETEHKPFFESLFSEKEIITGALIQSLYTSFGMSVYEQMAVILADSAGFYAERQYKLLGEIDSETEQKIDSYWNDLKSALKNKQNIKSDKEKEFKMIANSIKNGQALTDGDSVVDLYIKKPNGDEFFIDITTVKNNLKSFEVLKLKLLRWIGLKLSVDKNARFNTLIAIPYNPYYPNDYISSRWNATILDEKYDILVQDNFWNFVGNDNSTYTELLDIFKEVGNEVEEEINNFLNEL